MEALVTALLASPFAVAAIGAVASLTTGVCGAWYGARSADRKLQADERKQINDAAASFRQELRAEIDRLRDELAEAIAAERECRRRHQALERSHQALELKVERLEEALAAAGAPVPTPRRAGRRRTDPIVEVEGE